MRFGLTLSGLLCLPILLFAQSKKDTTNLDRELEEVTVFYKKWEQKLNDIPNRISKVKLSDVRLRNPATMADVLAGTGEVFIQKSQQGGGSPMIRGFATNRVLLVVDGVRMNNAIYRSGNIQNVISLDPLALEDAEVIFGPGSLIYGSDAIGGVMDFHTLQPRFAKKNNTLVKGNLTTRYASANQEQTVHADVNIANNKVSWLGSFTFSHFGDLRMGNRGGPDSYLRKEYIQRIGSVDSIIKNANPLVQRFTGYEQKNIMSKLRWKPTDNWDIQYAFHYSNTSNIPRYDRLIEYANNRLRFARWDYGPQAWQMHHVQVQNNKASVLYDAVKLVAAFQQYEESRIDRRRGNNWERSQIETVNAWSINLDFNKSFNEKSEIFYGAEWVKNDIGSKAFERNIISNQQRPVQTRYPNGSDWNSWGAYASYRYRPKAGMTITSGLRINQNKSSAEFDRTFFAFPFSNTSIQAGNFTGNLGMAYQFATGWQLNALVSSGFRMPNIDDIGKVFESAPGLVVVPNPNLRPEYVWNGELGIQYKQENNWEMYFTLFGTRMNNALTRRPFQFLGSDSLFFDGRMSSVEAIQNVASATVWGIQAGWGIHLLPSLVWKTQLNLIQGRETDDVRNEQVPLRHAPPFYGNTSITFRNKKWEILWQLEHHGEVRAEQLAPSERVKQFIYATDAQGRPYCPSWYAMHLKSSFQVSSTFSMQLGWENITNQRYRPYSSGIVAPGSQIIISARLKW